MQLRYERRNDRIEGNVQSETLLFAIRVAHLAFSVIHSCAVQAHYIKHKIASRITHRTHSIQIYGVVWKNKEPVGNS